jgi:ferredoxin
MSREQDSIDVPRERGGDWGKRAKEVRQRDNNVCQRCGNHNRNDEYDPLSMEVHHIVPGKFLPKADARLDLNLVTLCGSCHSRLEGAHVERQFAETDRDDALHILQALKEREQSLHSLARDVGLSKERLRPLVSQLERLNCLQTCGRARYRATCPGAAWSAAEKVRRELA